MNFSNLARPGPLLILLIAAILLFGWKRMPDAARSLGRSLRILKAETKGLMDDGKSPDNLDEKADAQSGRQPLAKEPGSEAVSGEVVDAPNRTRDSGSGS